MALHPNTAYSVRIGVKPAQTREDLEELIKWILHRGGCMACGRLAVLQIGFQERVSPELQKAGAIDLQEQLAR